MKRYLLPLILLILPLAAFGQNVYKSGSQKYFKKMDWASYGIKFEIPTDFNITESSGTVFKSGSNSMFFNLTPVKNYKGTPKDLAQGIFNAYTNTTSKKNTRDVSSTQGGYSAWEIIGSGYQQNKPLVYLFMGLVDYATNNAFKVEIVFWSNVSTSDTDMQIALEIMESIEKMDQTAGNTYTSYESASSLYQKGLDAIDSKDYSGAITYLNQALSKDPGLHKAYNDLAVAYINSGRYDEGITACNNALRYEPKHPEALFNIGLAYELKGNYASSIDYYFRSLDARPNYKSALEGLGYVYEKQGNNGLAQEYFIKAAKAGSTNAKDWLAKKNINWENNSSYNNNNTSNANTVYKSGSKKTFKKMEWASYGVKFEYPIDFRVVESSGYAFKAEGNTFKFHLIPTKSYYGTAKSLANDILYANNIIDPKHTADYTITHNGYDGWQLIGSGRHNGKAVVYFFVGLVDKTTATGIRLEMIYEAGGDINTNISIASEIKASIQKMEESVNNQYAGNTKETAAGLYDKGMDALDLKDYPAAVSYLKEAVTKDPNYAKAYNPLGVAYINQGFYDEGITACLNSLSHGLKQPETYFNLGLAYEMKKNYEKSLEYYFKALEERPGYHAANEGLGYTYEKMGRTDLATDYFKKAARGGEKNAQDWLVKRGLHWEDGKNSTINASVNSNTGSNTNISNNNSDANKFFVADVDLNLPKTKMSNPDAIAVVIGNSEYRKTASVDFAVNDARSMKKYLIEVLGYKEGNIFYIENATKGDFEVFFGAKDLPEGKLFNTVKPGKSDVFIFYSGHGAPGLKDQTGYFVPVECDPQYVEIGGYSSKVFYENLSKIPARNITVVLDACFSGVSLYKNISPIVIKAKENELAKNLVILSSSSSDEVSSWYNEQKHGMFTYFLLKAIHNKNADLNKDNKLTFEEVYQFISDKADGVPYYARRFHNVEQTPGIKGTYTNKVFIEY